MGTQAPFTSHRVGIESSSCREHHSASFPFELACIMLRIVCGAAYLCPGHCRIFCREWVRPVRWGTPSGCPVRDFVFLV